MDEEWIQEWPKKVGRYWFYSYRYGKISCGQECKPELMLMDVWQIANGLLYVANGQPVSKSEPEEVWFLKAELPNTKGLIKNSK